MNQVEELRAQAAYLPDDVAKMVERLRCYLSEGPLTSPFCEVCKDAADMIERLAENRVPEGMVLVPREPTEDEIDAPRGFLQMIRNRTGCIFAQAREHCVLRSDNMALWPDWARNEQGYVSEAGAALFIYQLMLAAGEVAP